MGIERKNGPAESLIPLLLLGWVLLALLFPRSLSLPPRYPQREASHPHTARWIAGCPILSYHSVLHIYKQDYWKYLGDNLHHFLDLQEVWYWFACTPRLEYLRGSLRISASDLYANTWSWDLPRSLASAEPSPHNITDIETLWCNLARRQWLLFLVPEHAWRPSILPPWHLFPVEIPNRRIVGALVIGRWCGKRSDAGFVRLGMNRFSSWRSLLIGVSDKFCRMKDILILKLARTSVSRLLIFRLRV